jgi:hypothetical protein
MNDLRLQTDDRVDFCVWKGVYIQGLEAEWAARKIIQTIFVKSSRKAS